MWFIVVVFLPDISTSATSENLPKFNLNQIWLLRFSEDFKSDFFPFCDTFIKIKLSSQHSPMSADFNHINISHFSFDTSFYVVSSYTLKFARTVSWMWSALWLPQCYGSQYRHISFCCKLIEEFPSWSPFRKIKLPCSLVGLPRH